MVADQEEDVSTAVDTFIEKLAAAQLGPDVIVEPAPETAADRRADRLRRPRSRYDDEARDAMEAAVVRLYIEEDLAAPLIAERLGIHVATVYNHLNRAGVQRKRPAKSRNKGARDFKLDARRQEVKRLYVEEKLVVREIAERMQVHQSTVLHDLRTLEVPRRGSGTHVDTVGGLKQQRRAHRRQEVKRLWAEGRQTSEIAEVLGASTSTIQNDLREMREAGELSRIDAPVRRGLADKNVLAMFDRAVEQMSTMAELLLGQNLSELDLPPEKAEALERGLATVARSVAYARRSIRKGTS